MEMKKEELQVKEEKIDIETDFLATIISNEEGSLARSVSAEQCCRSVSGIWDPESGAFLIPRSGAFLIPRSGMGKISGSGSGMNNPDHISEWLETFFLG
jgi:hypothetical protein